MPRKPLIRTPDYPYHVMARVNNKEAFPLAIHDVWAAVGPILAEAASRYGVELYAFVLMINHFHMMLRTPDSNLDESVSISVYET